MTSTASRPNFQPFTAPMSFNANGQPQANPLSHLVFEAAHQADLARQKVAENNRQVLENAQRKQHDLDHLLAVKGPQKVFIGKGSAFHEHFKDSLEGDFVILPKKASGVRMPIPSRVDGNKVPDFEFISACKQASRDMGGFLLPEEIQAFGIDYKLTMDKFVDITKKGISFKDRVTGRKDKHVAQQIEIAQELKIRRFNSDLFEGGQLVDMYLNRHGVRDDEDEHVALVPRFRFATKTEEFASWFANQQAEYSWSQSQSKAA